MSQRSIAVSTTRRPYDSTPFRSHARSEILTFARPDGIRRREAMAPALGQLGFSSGQIEAMVVETGPREDRSHGFTYSDLTQRLLPAIVLDAYPERAVNPDSALEIARNMMPTVPFQDGGP